MDGKNVVSMFIICVFAVFGMAAVSYAGETPSIEGTYKLVSRTLPDGKVLKEPEVIGLTTYAKDERHVLFAVKGDDGRYGGLIIKSKYSLTEKEYSEENLAFLKNFGAKTITPPLGKGTRPVSMKDGRIEFVLPTSDDLPVVIQGDTMTVGVKGKDPVDVYKKMK